MVLINDFLMDSGQTSIFMFLDPPWISSHGSQLELSCPAWGRWLGAKRKHFLPCSLHSRSSAADKCGRSSSLLCVIEQGLDRFLLFFYLLPKIQQSKSNPYVRFIFPAVSFPSYPLSSVCCSYSMSKIFFAFMAAMQLSRENIKLGFEAFLYFLNAN